MVLCSHLTLWEKTVFKFETEMTFARPDFKTLLYQKKRRSTVSFKRTLSLSRSSSLLNPHRIIIVARFHFVSPTLGAGLQDSFSVIAQLWNYGKKWDESSTGTALAEMVFRMAPLRNGCNFYYREPWVVAVN